MSNVFVSLEDDGSQWVMLEDYLTLQNKFREFTDYVYEIVSVNCTDVGEAHAGLQEEIIAIRKSGLTQRAADGVCTCGSLGQRKGDDWPHAKDCPYPRR